MMTSKGMLSKKEETKPSPSVVCQPGSGRLSTGIMDAQVTSESRNTLPRAAFGSSDQSGLRQAEVSNSAAQTAEPRKGNRDEYS